MWSSKQLISSLDKRAVQEHVVSYLPLAHVAAQILDIYVVLVAGGTTWFAQPDALKVNMCFYNILYIWLGEGYCTYKPVQGLRWTKFDIKSDFGPPADGDF